MPVIVFAVFIDLVGLGLIIPILPFITLYYGGSPLTGTLLLSLYSLMAFLSGPILGRLSDHFGRKPVLAFSFIGSALAYLALAFADDLTTLYMARALSGIMGGNLGVVMATMSDLSGGKERGQTMRLIGVAYGLGFAIGPGLGGYLAHLSSEPSIFLPGLMAAFLSATALILTLIFVPETRAFSDQTLAKNNHNSHASHQSKPLSASPSAGRSRDILQTPGNLALLFMFAIVAIGQSVSFSITPFWSTVVLNWGESQVGFLMMLVGLITATVQYFTVGPLFRRLGEEGTVCFGALFQISGCILLLALPGTSALAMLVFPMIMTGLTFSFPALNSLIAERNPPDLQGAALGLGNGISALGRVAGPIAAGFIFSSDNPSAPFWITLSVGILVFLWGITEKLKHRRA